MSKLPPSKASDDYDLSVSDQEVIDQLQSMAINHPPSDDDSDGVASMTGFATLERPRPRDLSGEYSTVGGMDLSPFVSSSESKKTPKFQIIGPNVTSGWNNLCCGLIGVQQNAFCLKTKLSCKSHRDGGTHLSSKFEPDPRSFYICKNKNKTAAWAMYSVDYESLSNLPGDHIQEGIELPLNEWKALFSIANSNDDNRVQILSIEDLQDKVDLFMNNPDKIKAFKTPAKAWDSKINELEDEVKQELKQAIQFISGDHMPKFEEIDEGLSNHLSNLTRTVKMLLVSAEQLGLDVQNKADVSDVATDLLRLNTIVQGIQAHLGKPVDTNYPDLWSAVENVNSKQVDGALFKAMHEGIKTLQDQFVIIEGHQSVNNTRWAKFARNWIPVLTRHDKMVHKLLKWHVKMTNSMESMSVADMDRMLDTPPSSMKISSHRDAERAGPSSPPPIDSKSRVNEKRIEELEQKLLDFQGLEERLHDLESRQTQSTSMSYPTDKLTYDNILRSPQGFGLIGVAYKNFTFANPDAVEAWMSDHMSVSSHGFFVDIISFMEFFGGDRYIEKSDTLNDVHMSKKVGYSSQYDSTVAASFQNVLPGPFGRKPTSSMASGTTELDFDPELPGLPSYNKWDLRDGSTGRRYWIEKECRKTFLQIESMIRQYLSGPAQLLATDLLMDCKSLCDRLSQFISQSYEDTMNSGRFDASQAWVMTCKFVKRIFTEISDVRIIARDGVHTDDPATTSAKFLFATLRAHQIMTEFMRLNIKDHPSISSEMVKYICYSQPSTDTANVFTRIGNLETLQRGDQSNISKLESRFKKLENWKTDAEKTIKRLNSSNS